MSTVEPKGAGRVALALLVLLIPMSILAFGMAAPAASGDPAAVTETDRQLLIKVRQAGLWEIPAGQQAQQQAASQTVKDVGAKIAAQHVQLDQDVRAVAAKLGVVLPNQPSEEQQGWLKELSGKFGTDFDIAFANLLRAAHGKVFSAIAQVRAGTRNDMIRDFAGKCNDVVKGHMQFLESTGQVDFNALPEANLNAPAASSPHGLAAASQSTGGVSIGLAVLISLLVLVMTIGVLRALRAR